MNIICWMFGHKLIVPGKPKRYFISCQRCGEDCLKEIVGKAIKNYHLMEEKETITTLQDVAKKRRYKNYYLIVNGQNQPLYSWDDKRLWVFYTKIEAQDFLDKRKAIDDKQVPYKSRSILEVNIEEI